MRYAVVLLVAVGLAPGTAQAQEQASAKIADEKVAALSVAEACDTILKDLKPGQHSFSIVNPHTCCPVTVCFCLPCGCYEVRYCCDKIRFDYPGIRKDVVIKFKKNGDVAVH